MFDFIKKKIIISGKKTNQRGVAIYFVAVTMLVILTIALGVNLLSIGQIRNLNESSDSVVAFAAAETGIEWALKNVPNAADCATKCTGAGGECFPDFVIAPAGCVVTCSDCTGRVCVKSVGTYNNTKRALKIIR